MILGIRAATLAVALVMTLAGLAAAQSVDELLQTLRGGGHVIVFRHGATHADQADTDPLNIANVAKQRHLNDAGRAQAKAVARDAR